MEVIPVNHEKEVNEPHITYCAEQPHSAASSFALKFGIEPEKVYHKLRNGRSTCYVPAPVHILQSFYSGVYHDNGINPSD